MLIGTAWGVRKHSHFPRLLEALGEEAAGGRSGPSAVCLPTGACGYVRDILTSALLLVYLPCGLLLHHSRGLQKCLSGVSIALGTLTCPCPSSGTSSCPREYGVDLAFLLPDKGRLLASPEAEVTPGFLGGARNLFL